MSKKLFFLLGGFVLGGASADVGARDDWVTAFGRFVSVLN